MKVSLVDVDGHNFPNLALMKLSAWHKANGDDVDWYMPLFSHPDRIYASKVFTFTPEYIDYNLNDPQPIKGGTGYDAAVKLPDEIEEMSPDYSIYPQYPDFCIGYLTRGCIRHCPWCVVPRKEGNIKEVGDIGKIAVRKNVVLMDNNFLAASSAFVAEQLIKAHKLGVKLDFNQALDARLINHDNASMLAKTKWIRYPRFSCDTTAMLEPVKRAVALIREHGYKREILIYFLAKETSDTLFRINQLDKIDNKILPFVMPFRNLDGDGQIQDKEIRHLARWCNRSFIRKSCTFKEYKYKGGINA